MVRQMLGVYALLLLALIFMVIGEFWLGVSVLFLVAAVASA